jgi:alkylated DNA repair dioxygenase AlkB
VCQRAVREVLTALLSFAILEQVFASLFPHDEWQPSLLALGDPAVDRGFAGLQRIALDEASWLDHVPRWLTGSDHLFAELVARVPWQQRRVVMFDRMVDEPRLTWWWQRDTGPCELGLPVLHRVAAALRDRYERDFDSIGCNLYRRGSDSVAWHGDRVRHASEDPVVATVSLGSPRPFHVRPRGGGPSRSFLLGQGDLLVMGGACQHDWEHSVPKVARAGPRLSVTYRHGLPPPEPGPSLAAGRAVHPSAWRRSTRP